MTDEVREEVATKILAVFSEAKLTAADTRKIMASLDRSITIVEHSDCVKYSDIEGWDHTKLGMQKIRRDRNETDEKRKEMTHKVLMLLSEANVTTEDARIIMRGLDRAMNDRGALGRRGVSEHRAMSSV